MVLLALLLACAAPPAPVAVAPCGGCHAPPPGAHAAIGCQPCHGGDPAATDAAPAHRGLEREPGALDTVDRTCGLCHADIVARVRTLPMATGRGIVGVDRFVFGEIPAASTDETLADVLAAAHPTPGQDHLRRLCAGCHLGTRRANRDDAVTGGSGCAACHRRDAVGHPAVDRRVADDRCLGCHSRSSRISLTYAGFMEGPGPTTLPDGRTLTAVAPDLHAVAGLACIDCHLTTEVMGDGVSRAHQADQVEIRCQSCHGTGPRAGIRGTPLTNVVDGALVGKLDGVRHPLRVVPADHAGRGHDRLDCAACHAAVAPTCVSCHTSYDKAGTQWDFGASAVVPGVWVEVGAPGTLSPPALGVSPEGRIRPAIPGMIGEIAGRDVRAFALLDPHATRRPARTCVDCHTSPGPLGLGTGALDVATFRFTPDRPATGGVAHDGWTTLGAATPGQGLRAGTRSLDSAEQRRILRVGVCLGCHDGPALGAWTDLRARPATCRLGRGWWDDR